MRKTTSCIRVYADPRQIADGKAKLQQAEQPIQTLSRILALCGNEVRLKILYLLYAEEQLCPCDLSDMLGMSIPAVSQHLRKLKDAGLVLTRRAAQTIFYRIAPEHMPLLQPFFAYLEKTSTANTQQVLP
ncbi:ArsR/SmtB family transcription factor [Thermoflavifilum thermophilum]|uniref:DNA-binding transcriptional regulator, ArsR family n=1 Tax=Thermoflavifilum thermophilum TaxID=1393122 RepID=A0A1I7NE22_9BACT|nr:metalloregulator ArsR/SmtB family transcription factor [Thermoflavifilum thermophilum]SFV32796.1 DNA-binding transcriptional regulator, ArsR family [Thermoflavifilum thermophilum]